MMDAAPVGTVPTRRPSYPQQLQSQEHQQRQQQRFEDRYEAQKPDTPNSNELSNQPPPAAGQSEAVPANTRQSPGYAQAPHNPESFYLSRPSDDPYQAASHPPLNPNYQSPDRHHELPQPAPQAHQQHQQQQQRSYGQPSVAEQHYYDPYQQPAQPPQPQQHSYGPYQQQQPSQEQQQQGYGQYQQQQQPQQPSQQPQQYSYDPYQQQQPSQQPQQQSYDPYQQQQPPQQPQQYAYGRYEQEQQPQQPQQYSYDPYQQQRQQQLMSPQGAPPQSVYKHSPAYREPPPQQQQHQQQQQPQQQGVHRVFVDWPTERDDDEYRFVSSRLAEVEDSLDPVIRSQDLYRDDEVHPQVSSAPMAAVRPPVPPAVAPGPEESLNEEIAYQEEMRRRLRRQQEEIAQLANSVVPPLNLSRTSTPREDGVRDSLDISLRSESEEDEERPSQQPLHAAGALTVAAPSSQPAPHLGGASSVGQRLSAQHRAEMTQLLSSLGGDPELAIDKELYASSRRSRQGHHGPGLDPAPPGAGPHGEELDENLEFLRKIHDYNQALRAKVQEEVWNAHASSAAGEGRAPPPGRKGGPGARQGRNRAAPGDGQRSGQSAPPDVGRPLPSQTVGLRTSEPMEDFVRRNKSIPEQMQRLRAKSYSDRYRERHGPAVGNNNTRRASHPKANAHAPPNRSSHQPIREEGAGAGSSRPPPPPPPIRAPLGPIQLAPGMTVDLNLHIHPHGGASLGHVRRDHQQAPQPQTQVFPREGPGSPWRARAAAYEREEEWAFVHDPEHAFQPPSPRAMAQRLQGRGPPRLHYDEELLSHQAAMAASLVRRHSPLPPIARPPEAAGSPQGQAQRYERPQVLRNPAVEQSPNAGSYLEAFRQAGQPVRKPQYREYTLRDYRHLRSIASMGGLGPDFENEGYKSQRTRDQRRKTYSQKIGSRNRDEIANSKKKAPPPGEQRLVEKFVALDQAKPTKRQLMLEYMKGLEERHHLIEEEEKRMRELEEVRPTEHKLQKKLFNTGDLDDKKAEKEKKEQILNDTEFEKLKRRHENERAAQESIRQKTESSRTQAATVQQ